MRLLIFILACLAHFTNAYHTSSASAGVTFTNGNGLRQEAHIPSSQYAASKSLRNRRMYAMCPPHFQRVGTECYSLLTQTSSWLEAHFFCKDKNAKLAEPQKVQDRKLRVFLKKYDEQVGSNDPIWIGATYDWQSNVWQWSISGKNLTYDAFSRMEPEIRQNLENHCAVYDPNLEYRWSARPCPDKFRFICQHKMPKVSERNRHKVYNRWNATYPHQFANEVILEVVDQPGKNGARSNVRVKAIGSDEQIIIPKRRAGNRSPHEIRRRPQHAQIQPNIHPNDIESQSTPTYLTTALRDNEIPAPTTTGPIKANNAPHYQRGRGHPRTPHDRNVSRQRQKELRRLQRKKERSQRMQQEKERRLAEQRQRIRENEIRMQQERERYEQEQQDQQQKSHEQQGPLPEIPKRDLDELRQREVADQERQRQQQLAESKRQLETLKQQQAEEQRKREEYNSSERIRQERISHQRERELQERMEKEKAMREAEEERAKEEAKRERERLEKEEQQQKEYEERLKQAQDERERQMQEQQERKRQEDEENRRRLEEEEKQRQEEIKRQEEKEEKRLELKRLEEARKLEKQELERLEEENRRREELLRQREEEIARREAEQRRIEEEEERLKKELEETERRRKEEHEAQIRAEEEALRAREEAEQREAKEHERQKHERFEALKKEEDERVRQNLEEKRRKYAERLSKLSPEDQRKFFEMRKRRKSKKTQELLKQKQNPNDGNEAFEDE